MCVTIAHGWLIVPGAAVGAAVRLWEKKLFYLYMILRSFRKEGFINVFLLFKILICLFKVFSPF